MSVATTLAVGLLPLLAACGGSSDKAGADAASSNAGNSSTTNADGAVQLTVPGDADDATKKKYIEQNAISACMKKQGFTFTPHVAAESVSTSWIDGEDYALAKKSRQKYGFGNYSTAVYPNSSDAPHADVTGRGAGKVLTHDEDQKGLTAAQRKAYSEALSGPPATNKTEEKTAGCELKGSEAANGPALSAAEEEKAWKDRQEENRANGLELNGDTQLVALAQEFATCLKGQGIAVATTQPTGIVDMVRLAQVVPENHFSMGKEAALPLLTKEIDISLKDLECGKKFRAAYFPKEKVHPYWGEGA
ncbi:hypothetical protein ACIQM0_23855 [Streptomyces sp. NPDC091387]|uniref:hypothetical protein n=1 Tax=Streptomyces sp. NPDC091387 TaxID=3365998 RepID=UPI00380F63F1